MIVYVLIEESVDFKETDSLGVVSSPENADKLLNEYYEDDIVDIHHRDVNEGGIVWIKTIISVGNHKDIITLREHKIDEL